MGDRLLRFLSPRLSVLAVALLCACPLRADRLELVNGDVISGTIRQMDADRVLMETEYGVLEIDRSAVRLGQFGTVDGSVSDGLVFHFPFAGSVLDATGLYRATNNGMRFVADREGLPAAAVRSDGTGTFLSLQPTQELNELSQFSLAFWIRLEDLASTQYLFSKWTSADGDKADGKFTVRTSGGDVTLYLVDPDGTYHWLTARGAVKASEWHSIAVSFAMGRASIHVDGVLVASRRFDFTGLFEDTAPVLIMTAQARTDDAFAYYNTVGVIDELRLYSRALAPDEVSLLAGLSETE